MVFTALFLLFSSLFAVNDETNFKCSTLTTKDLCTPTIWCTWVGASSTCVNDPCLKYVADSVAVAEACDVNPTFTCKLFYLTDLHDCSNGELIQSDRYCRADSSAYDKDSMNECFYNDMKGLATGTTTGVCPAPLCKVNDTTSSSNGPRRYCEESGADVCNEVYNSNTPFFCGCLGSEYCKLYPGCQTVGTTCIEDPCYVYGATAAECVGTSTNPFPSTLSNVCSPKKVNIPVGNSATPGYKCINKSRTDVNGCFDLQNISTSPGSQPYPECLIVNENSEVCGTGVVFNDSDGVATNETCKWVEIAGGFFSAAPQHYCNDGKRSVPSPTGSDGFVFKIPSVIALLALFVFLLV